MLPVLSGQAADRCIHLQGSVSVEATTDTGQQNGLELHLWGGSSSVCREGAAQVSGVGGLIKRRHVLQKLRPDGLVFEDAAVFTGSRLDLKLHAAHLLLQDCLLMLHPPFINQSIWDLQTPEHALPLMRKGFQSPK